MGRSLQYVPRNADASIVVTASGRLLSSDGFFTNIVVSQYGSVTNARAATIFLGSPPNNNYFKIKDDTMSLDFATSTIVAKGGTATVPISILGIW